MDEMTMFGASVKAEKGVQYDPKLTQKSGECVMTFVLAYSRYEAYKRAQAALKREPDAVWPEHAKWRQLVSTSL